MQLRVAGPPSSRASSPKPDRPYSGSLEWKFGSNPASLLRLRTAEVMVFRKHFGDWLTVHAHAERTPPRLTITFAVGELPQKWAAQSKRSVARTWTALVGITLLLPFCALLAASALHGVGIAAPMQWIGSSSIAIIAASVSLFVGIPVAFVVNLWRIVKIGLRRDGDDLEGLLALEFAPLHLAVVAVALVIGVLFVGHLAADSYACLNGVQSAC